MATPSVRVEGLRETVRQLERFGVATDDLKDAFGKISQEVVEEASDRVHVVTGDLRGTIRPARTKNKAVVRAGSAAVPYAAVVNYHNPGDEFLTGPANENPEEKVAKIEAELESLITKYGLR